MTKIYVQIEAITTRKELLTFEFNDCESVEQAKEKAHEILNKGEYITDYYRVEDEEDLCSETKERFLTALEVVK